MIICKMCAYKLTTLCYGRITCDEIYSTDFYIVGDLFEINIKDSYENGSFLIN
jgi:hypothetical protein